jgi:peroxiredoxin Q/BCP
MTGSDIVEPGSQAPDFRLPSTEQHELGLEDFRGKHAVVLYFYPQDDTPDGTAEALDFPRLADTQHVVAERFGVWGRRRFLGRESLGVRRATFVIDRQGRISAVFPDVKVERHAEAVLAAIDAAADGRTISKREGRT